MTNKQDLGIALDWDSEITQDFEFRPLAPGEYDFKVTKLEREYYDGSSKMAPCHKAVLEITIEHDAFEYRIRHALFLNSKFETQISAFFTSIGQKKKGETLRMNWAKVVGSKGRCKTGIKEYNGNEYSEVKAFLAPVEMTEKKFTAGAF